MPQHVLFATDIEGSASYLKAIINVYRRFIYFNNQEGLLFTNEAIIRNTHFVYGGDTIDNGCCDEEIMRLLTNFKKRYPNRVHLLIGNRDLNKLRYATELCFHKKSNGEYEFLLSDQELNKLPYWDLKEENKYIKFKNGIKDNPSLRLQWITEKTMGIKYTDWKKKYNYPSDKEIIQYLANGVINENGFIYEYLRNAELICRIDETIYCHGGLFNKDWKKGDAFFKVPAQKGAIKGNEYNSINVQNEDNFQYDEFDDVDEWIYALNQWKEEQLNQWKDQIEEIKMGKYDDNVINDFHLEDRKGNDLINYCVPTKQYSVIMGRITPDCKGKLSDEKAQKLANHGIHRIVVGHTPIGIGQKIVRNKKHQVIIQMADVTYSNGPKYSDINLRSHTLALEIFGKHSFSHGAVKLLNNNDFINIEFGLSYDFNDPFNDKNIGQLIVHNKKTNEKWIIYLKIKENNNWYIIIKIEGREYRYEKILIQNDETINILEPNENEMCV